MANASCGTGRHELSARQREKTIESEVMRTTYEALREREAEA